MSRSFLIAFLLTACGSLPVKPSVTLGVIDYPAGQVIENTTNGQKMSQISSVEMATSRNVRYAVAFDGSRVPLASYDKAIAFKPDAWDAFINYVHSLERYLQNHCSN